MKKIILTIFAAALAFMYCICPMTSTTAITPGATCDSSPDKTPTLTPSPIFTPSPTPAATAAPTPAPTEPPINLPEDTVEKMLAALSEMDMAEAELYIVSDNTITYPDEGGTDETSVIDENVLMETIFKNMGYKIISSRISDEYTAVVTAEITVTDMKPVVNEFFTNMIEYLFSIAFTDPQPSEEEQQSAIKELFTQSCMKEDLDTITNIVEIMLIKTSDDEWKIQPDEVLREALFGGFLSALNDLFSPGNSDENEYPKETEAPNESDTPPETKETPSGDEYHNQSA